ncbi:high-affinity nicotinic acid transporter [Leptodontidium sp. MPI-SDFR-AT-0119]|nr:high-affinity nicotinic acid transporter [Leptodontidium sp. MPI-SDFR-AT-0119]
MDTVNNDSVRTSLKDSLPPTVHCEKVLDSPQVGEIRPPQYDAAATRRLLRKLDIRLLPFFALLYLLSFLDRTNIGNARLFGLVTDLGMDPKSLQYNTALAVFFPTYIIAEIPSNMMMKRLTPSIWLSFIMIAWSAIVIGMGFVHNFAGLLACRVLLGLAEGGLFPGVAYYITLWYPRHETGFRIAFFFSAATAAGAFGGLLAAAIGKMAGLGGKAGWSWIFIIEGLITIVVGVLAYFVIVDSPEKARFVTEEDKAEIRRRIAHDANELADEFDMRYVRDALRDWKIWAHCLCTIGIFTPVYSFSFFLPTIIRNMGYSNTHAQLMSAPPYVVGCLVTICAGYIADKTKQRGLFQALFSATALVGWVMLISSHRPAIQYTGTFFACSGIFACVPLGVTWNSNNIGGSLKRGVGIAMHVGSGNLGGILASFIYLPKDSPCFIQGHAILIALISLSFCLSLGIRFWLKAENARRDAWAAEHNMRPEDMTREQKLAERHMGDYASFFR